MNAGKFRSLISFFFLIIFIPIYDLINGPGVIHKKELYEFINAEFNNEVINDVWILHPNTRDAYLVFKVVLNESPYRIELESETKRDSLFNKGCIIIKGKSSRYFTLINNGNSYNLQYKKPSEIHFDLSGVLFFELFLIPLFVVQLFMSKSIIRW